MPTPSESRVTVSGKPSKAVAAIITPRRNTRGRVYYDWQFVAGKFDEDARPRGPKWLRDALGPDMFDTVVIVTIEGDNVDDEFLENVGKLHGVEKVDVVGRAAPDLTAAGMAQLCTLPRLKTLNTRGVAIPRGFVTGLAGRTGLRHLWLPQAAVTDDEMAIIGGFTDLEFLQLDGSNVTDRGFAHVANLKKLTILDMPGVRITDLAPVADLVQLDLLVLAPARATLARSVPGPDGPLSLGPLRRLTKVTQLTLGATRIEDRELAVVAGLPKLYNLMIGARGVTEAGFARIAESQSLASLGLADTSIADLRPLSPRLHAISTLWMENSHLTDSGIEPLSRAIRLTDLNIAGSKITDAGLDHLAPLTSVWRLRLDRSAITDAGLARLKSLKSLEILSLTETKLTDSSVETLAGFQSLKSLNLDGSGISPAGIERLKQALPKARISSARMPE
jgi:Leucine-rich repeat (LRR) protein